MSSAPLRLTAFAADPAGGNPAGVVLDARGLSDARMLAIAAEIGFSETAFAIARAGEDRAYDVRYFSPRIEVPFCGHATIATGVALARRDGPGPLVLHTPAGVIGVATAVGADGLMAATLTSVEPRVEPAPAGLVTATLAALDWAADELDPALPPRIAFAGARHLVLAAATRERLARLDYDGPALTAAMEAQGLITVDLVWREDATTFHARNPFPVGGVVEDPATGAAAAAFGGYLRALGLVAPPVTVTVHQGADMGRPSRLTVTIGARGGIAVSGTAVPLR